MFLFNINLVLLCIPSIFYTTQGKSQVIELDEDNWHEMLTGEWMVEFYAPWCPACKTLQPIWAEFGSWSDDLGISVGKVDVTASPGLSGRFLVTALPTIFHIKDGVFRQYRGTRDKEEFLSFIEDKKWVDLDEVSAWKSPASFQMSIIAQFFKLSMVVKGVHSTFVENYGLPVWASYVFFALMTIVVGAVLGLILVCIIDFIFPVKPHTPMPIKEHTATQNSDEEDLLEEKESSNDDESQEDNEEVAADDIEERSPSQSENSEPEANASPSSSPSVRKRRSRKAD